MIEGRDVDRFKGHLAHRLKVKNHKSRKAATPKAAFFVCRAKDRYERSRTPKKQQKRTQGSVRGGKKVREVVDSKEARYSLDEKLTFRWKNAAERDRPGRKNERRIKDGKKNNERRNGSSHTPDVETRRSLASSIQRLRAGPTEKCRMIHL